MLSEIRDFFTSTLGEREIPEEVVEFRLAQAFGCLPHELEEMTPDEFLVNSQIMLMEEKAGQLKALQQQFYG